jgi:hypothetical protein
MNQMNEDKLLSLLNKELSNALGAGQGELKNDRIKSLEYYKGKPKGDLAPSPIPGRSDVVSPVVFEKIEWILPSLIRMFTQNSSIAEFTPRNEEAEVLAKHATEYIGNTIFYVQNDGFNILQTSFKDALQCKNGFIKTWWDATSTEEKEEYEDITDIQLQMLLEDEEVEIISIEQDEEEPDTDTYSIDPLEPRSFKVKLKRKKEAGQVKHEVIPPEDIRVHHRATDCDDAVFIAQRFERTVLELRNDGYDIPDDVTGNSDRIDEEHWVRHDYDNVYDDVNNDDPSLKTVVGYECYFRIDYDGDGIPELRKITVVNNTIIQNVEAPNQPFVTLTPIINPHQLYGISIADLTINDQKTKTGIQRAIIDNLNMQINGRTWALTDQVNMDDLLNSRPGGVVRIKSPGAVGTLDTGRADLSSGLAVLDAIEQQVERKTGFTQMSMGGDSPLISQTATGANILTNRADARIELIGRNFANALKKVIWKSFELVTKYQDYPETIRVQDKWVTVNPREWTNQLNLAVNVGLGTNNKQETIDKLMALQNGMMAAKEAGIIKPDNVYNAGVKLAETLGFTNPDKYFTNPQNEPDPALVQKIEELQGQLEQGQQMYEMLKQEHDTFFLQLNNKELELGIKTKELELKYEELELKKLETRAEIIRKQAELGLKENDQQLKTMQVVSKELEKTLPMQLGI